MRIYYNQAEIEPGKHNILKIWSSKFLVPRPEDSVKEAINIPYGVIEIDEDYNRELAKNLASPTIVQPLNSSTAEIKKIPDRFYVDNSIPRQICLASTGASAPIVGNPQIDAFKKSALYGLSQAQLETFIDNNVTTLASAKEYLKKLSAVVLLTLKQTNME